MLARSTADLPSFGGMLVCIYVRCGRYKPSADITGSTRHQVILLVVTVAPRAMAGKPHGVSPTLS